MIAASLLAGQALPAFAAETEPAVQNESLKIATLSDTHYLSPDLIRDTADFTEHLNSDRKMFAESDAFLTALLNTVKQDDPDVLLISGDLTKDGEKEGHEDLAEKLKQFEEETGAEVYITPGNHDLNNSNAMNFNTADGAAVRQDAQVRRIIRKSIPTWFTATTPLSRPLNRLKANRAAAFPTRRARRTALPLSPSIQPATARTIRIPARMSMKPAAMSARNWRPGWLSRHRRQKNAEIQSSACSITVWCPHFSMEPELLPMYLVNDYERLAQVYADAGMSYIFTGHMHANDIATVTTEAGNTLYDIETGSVVTYPSPARSVTLNRTISGGKVSETMEVKTYTNVGPVTFTNPVTGQEQTIEDISAYGREHGFSNAMLTTTVNGFLRPYYEQILQSGGSKAAIESLIDGLLGDSLPIENITLEQLIDVALPLLLPGADSGEEIYYDSAEGGIAVNKKVSFLTLSLVIPNEGLKDTLNALLQKLDNEVLAKPEVMDTVIESLIVSLTGLPVSMDGDVQKTLLDYANYIYQSHLGGEDSSEQPAWVTEATSKIESGELLGTVLAVLIQDITGLVDQILGSVSLEELLGAADGTTQIRKWLRSTAVRRCSGQRKAERQHSLPRWVSSDGKTAMATVFWRFPKALIRRWDILFRSSWTNLPISEWIWIS